jgi:serine/threonine protein kinase
VADSYGYYARFLFAALGTIGFVCTIVDGKASIQGTVVGIPGARLTSVLPPGKNGAVFEGWDNLGRHIAAKIWFRPGRSPARMALQARAEASKIAALSHRYIGKVYAAHDLPGGKFCMVMEFIDGVTLRDYLSERPGFLDRHRIWAQISDAVYAAHRIDVFHGDLHDRNILVAPEGVRLIDFGTSAFQRSRADSRRRESRLLLQLARQLIHEEDPDSVWDQPFDRMDARLCLAAVNAWVELVYLASVPHPDILHDYMEVRSLAFRLGLVLEKHPYFPIARILEWLAAKEVPTLDWPLLQYLHAGLAASLAGTENFDIPTLEGPVETNLTEVEDLRRRLSDLYLSGRRPPSSFLAAWDSV